MTQQAIERDARSHIPQPPRAEPGFKPVALPALAAAVHAARAQASRPKVHEPPAILRKEAVLG